MFIPVPMQDAENTLTARNEKERAKGMAQIIRFPVKAQAASSGYDNLSRLIAVGEIRKASGRRGTKTDRARTRKTAGDGKTGSDRKRSC